MNISEKINNFLEQSKKVKNGFTMVSPMKPKELLEEIKELLDIKKTQPEDELHITVSYSTTDVEDLKAEDYEVEVTPIGYDLFGEENDILVLRVESKELTKRHKEILDMGADYSHGEYKPHLTITYDISQKKYTKENIKKLPLPKPFKVGNEVVRDLDLDYVPSNLEK